MPEPVEQTPLAAALAYARQGWKVFPLHSATFDIGGWVCSCSKDCASPAKHPRTRSGLDDATSDEDQITAWWGRWPDANVGLRTGSASGVVVVDVDSYHQGDDGLAELEAVYGALPPTLTADTGGGGRHLVFCHPEGMVVRNRTGLAPGVDLRGDGGYIVAAPSVHISGNPYAWRRPLVDRAPLPAWLAEPKREPRSNGSAGPLPAVPNASEHPWVQAALRGEIDELGRAMRGDRNHALNRAAFNLGQLVPHALSQGEVEGALEATARAIGLEESEIPGTLRSGLVDGMAEPRAIPERTLHAVGSARVRVLNEDPGPAPDSLTRATERAKEAPALFTRYSAAELMTMDRTFRWLARGMLVEPTYGQIAGELKSLKTYVSLFTMLGLADGHAIFGRFAVEQPQVVLAYIGEGGRVPWTRRLERVAAAVGVDAASLPLHLSFDVAPIYSDRFQESLRRDLGETGARVVFLDPYYAYHGTQTKAADLHQEGSLLSSLSAPCGEYGASLMVVNHFNQTGSGSDLKRITMAGSGEWADSWNLLSHREKPDVENGRFQLLMELGSRQWGGTSWDLDVDLGRFDAETGEYDGMVSWDLRRHKGGSRTMDESRVLEVVEESPFELTREEVAKEAGGNLRRMRDVVDLLLDRGVLDDRIETRTSARGAQRRVAVIGRPSEAGRSQTLSEEEM